MKENDIQLLREIYEHFDGIADGAPDASHSEKQALRFSEPLKRLISTENASDDGSGYYVDQATRLLYEDVPRATVNALISIAISLRGKGIARV